MSLIIVSARVHADNVEAAAAESRRTLAAIEAAAPDAGYAVCRAPDGVTFVAILDARDASDPLRAIPAFAEFHEAIGVWAAEPPSSETWEVVGSYGLFSRPTDPRPYPRIEGEPR